MTSHLHRGVNLAALFILFAATAWPAEIIPLWNGLPPGEVVGQEPPVLEIFHPAEKTSDTFLLAFPGGGYNSVNVKGEGYPVATYFNDRGVTVGVLKYRTPPRAGITPRYLSAWQDAQRAVRLVRSRATEWNIDQGKIGVMGFSAGGHLALMIATTSSTKTYTLSDDVDAFPCHVNFAIPVYPAYVLDDGLTHTNSNRGIGASLAADFAFDDRTPPMCLIHGSEDGYSALNSVAIYGKLFAMRVPAELHVYAKIRHGFGAWQPGGGHVGNWLDRVVEWMKITGYGFLPPGISSKEVKAGIL